jgi:hypothetical protein
MGGTEMKKLEGEKSQQVADQLKMPELFELKKKQKKDEHGDE